MNFAGRRARAVISLRAPLIVSVVAATAIPVELRAPGAFGFSFQPIDIAVNIAGFLPIAFALAGLPSLTPVTAVLAAAGISVAVELSQLVMMHRDPSVIDVMANTAGAAIGTAICTRWKLRPPPVTLSPLLTALAALMAAGLVAGVWLESGSPLSARGSREPGTLEAHWTFDEADGATADDASGHAHRGVLRGPATRTTGMIGRAVAVDGSRGYVDFDRPAALRLVGGLTVSAWINATSFPVDDAAVVSTMRHVGSVNDVGYGVGFQLDTTRDRGPRTIGFKLADGCGRLVARYGATPLETDRWYHIAGVYDGSARRLDVYLDGKLDNGALLGAAPGARRASREPLYVGRRSDLTGFEFAGAIDDVRIYSHPQSEAQIAADMKRPPLAPAAGRTDIPDDGGGAYHETASGRDPGCNWTSEREDARVPGAVAGLGVLVAVVCLGLWPGAGAAVALAAGVAAGALLLTVASPTLPPMNTWMLPLTSLAGALSVVVTRWRSAPDA